MEAKSTTTGTPVKSCKITRLGLKGTSETVGKFGNFIRSEM